MKGFVIGFLAASVLLMGAFFIFRENTTETKKPTQETNVQKYYCPMHPTVIADHPGDCPICGMKMVPMGTDIKEENSGGQTEHAMNLPEGHVPLKISPEKLQVMGVTYAVAREMDLQQSIRTVGRVQQDETRTHHIHTKFDGYIEDIFADYTGQFVRKGQSLFSVYSPELVATQQEYLLALKAQEQLNQSGGNLPGVDLVQAARQRLAFWDIGPSQIAELEESRKPVKALMIRSPVSGFITEKMVTHGTKVSPADNLYQIVDLSVVWVMADVYEINLPFIKPGTPATVTLPYSSNEIWNGKVTYINPVLDPQTRTAKARIEIANPSNLLKPEMYTNVLFGGNPVKGIAVPESAVIFTGERSIVFIATGDGEFEPREVQTGTKLQGYYEIRSGIAAGDRVVTSGNFLLDSESKLKAAISGSSGEHVH